VVVAGVISGLLFGTTLRAIGRGFGSGTLAEAAMECSATTSTKLVASAVVRNAAARAEDFTAFLCGGESSDRRGLTSI
jgi:hypothetical protein